MPQKLDMPVCLHRRPEKLISDDKRVIPRYLDFGHPPRIRSIFRRLAKVRRRDVPRMLQEVRNRFSGKHRQIEAVFRANYETVLPHIRKRPELTDSHKLLIGAYFTMEYSIESAALFNPSIVPHPDQEGVARGAMRFLMSLRATGEGHVSSIVFRRGVIGPHGGIHFDPPPRYAFSARPEEDKTFHKSHVLPKLRYRKGCQEIVERIVEDLGETFTGAQLRHAVDLARKQDGVPSKFRQVAAELDWLTHANYELHFPPDAHPAETVIFPATAHERNGIEDLRLVRFTDADGLSTYYGTYTAFDGQRIHPMLLETRDFHSFHVATLAGRYAKNKGMALFPRKIDGSYAMISRHDGESLYLLRSQHLHVWNSATRLQAPTEPWELVQIGNCGSPLETEAGWLLLTHGVGPLRQYCIGATLLDLNNPAKVIGRLRNPLMVPTDEERIGYVPNVVYSCGSVIHHGRLIIPYAMSDSRTSFAVVTVDELVQRLRACGP